MYKYTILGLVMVLSSAALVVEGAEDKVDIIIFSCRGEKFAGSQSSEHKSGDEVRFLVAEHPLGSPLKKIVLVAYSVHVGSTQVRLRGHALRGKEYSPDPVDDVNVLIGKPAITTVTGDARERVTLMIEAYRKGSAPPIFGPHPKCPFAI